MKMQVKTILIQSLVLAGVFGMSATVFADQFHYENVIIGDRAMGLGGAYAGISDDASGLVYNPAGLAFALSNDISGSANAFYSRKTTYKETIGSDDFVENSSGTMAPFFGGLQKLDKYSDGLVAGFGMYTSDSELKNQDDNIPAQGSIVRFHRAVTMRASTVHMGGALAKRFGPNVAIGFGLNYLMIDELTQEYQDAHTYAGTVNATRYYRVLTQNIRQYLTAFGVEPTLGAQIAIGGKISIGLMIRKPMLASQKMAYGSEQTFAYVDGNNQPASGASAQTLSNAYGELKNCMNGDGTNASYNSKVCRATLPDQKLDKPLGEMPATVRVGLAWFASPRFLWSTDISHHTAATGPGELSGNVFYKREAVTNYATGTEFYATPALPIRLAFFTNNDARPKVDGAKMNQPDHIDFIGGSLFGGWVQTNSQIAVGAIIQKGTGESQKLANTTIVQKVEALATTAAFSAMHNF